MLTLEQLAEIEKRAELSWRAGWNAVYSGEMIRGMYAEDIPALLATVRELQERERVLRDVLAKFDEIKPCAVCGRRIAWRYVGDGTYAINCDDLLVHTCHPPKE